jgi:hypothetical protein
MANLFYSVLVKYIMKSRAHSLIEIKSLFHNNLAVHNIEGYGGRHIQFFPPYNFLMDYHRGNRVEAEIKFIKWYFDSYLKYYNVPKKMGGMEHGSLDEIIRRYNFSEISPHMIMKNEEIILFEIRKLVWNKFNLYHSILENGYSLIKRDSIKAIFLQNKFILKGGHHRVAICDILGMRSVPVRIESEL